MMKSTAVFTVFISALLCVTGEGESPEFGSPDGSDRVNDEQTLPGPDSDSQSGREGKRYQTAEMADALLTSVNPVGIEALVPKHLQNPEFSGSELCDGGICEKAGEDEEKKEKSDSGSEPSAADENNSTETAKTYKVSCDKRSTSTPQNLTVQVLNASQDLMEFLNVNSTECTLVLFYTTWCQFSAQLAPHFNALPRVFPSMHFLALDASQHSSLSTRFGTVAVPNILLFQGVKPMARFNHTDRTLDTLTSFIANQTGFEAVPGQSVQDEDQLGPLPSVPMRSIDWLFVFSILFILGFAFYAVLRTDSIRLLIPGHEHEHQD